MDEHHHGHGKMDIREHERTFFGFVNAILYLVVVVAIVLLFLAAVNA